MPEPKPGLHLKLNQIPPIGRPVPIVQTRPIDTGHDFVRAQVQRLAPHAETRELRDGRAAFYDGERLVGFADPTTGQSHLVPLLEGLQREKTLRTPASQGARRLIAEEAQLFGEGSRVQAAAPIQLLTSNITQRGTRTDPAAVLATVKLNRQVNGLPVYGPGSSASASYSRNGLEGFHHRWSTTQVSRDKVEALAPKLIRDRLAEHVGDLADTRAVHLMDATRAYYDDGSGTLQPVYRYRVSTPSPDGVTAPGMLVGYLPIGEPVGILPALTPEVTVFPTETLAAGNVPTTGDIRVGRYVVREDNAGWVASANAFWDSLNFPFSSTRFQNAQYYWAEPRLFLDDKDSFVNAVHLALTEVHGNWGLFSTYKNYGDLVHLADIPSSGYGGDAAGQLAYWILHSCEVIPTSTDEKTSYDVWWNVFNGLHAAMGYRTEMWINDQVSSLFGLLLSLGAPVVSSWLSTVIHDNDYQNGDTYYDDNRNMTEPMGRPSAIAVTGHGDDTVTMVSPLPRPSSLTEWWYDN